MFFADCSLKATELNLKNGELQPWNKKSPTPARIISRFSRGSLLYNRTETFMGAEEGKWGGRFDMSERLVCINIAHRQIKNF